MKFLSLRDNAIFMVNFRERTRPSAVLSVAILVVVIVLFITMACYLARESLQTEQVPWVRWPFMYLAVCQGFVLLVLGAFSAGNMAIREQRSGTLEFHRTSPTPRLSQVCGLVLGAPVLEWGIVIGTMPISVGLALWGRVPFWTIVSFYASLFLTALFFHSLGVLGLAAPDAGKRKATAYSNSAIGAGLAIFLIMASLPAGGSGVAAAFHSTCAPAYFRIFEQVSPGPGFRVDAAAFTFCGVRFPSLLLQAIVQIPLIVLAWTAIMRKVSHPERPALSKTQLLAAAGMILFLYIGTVISMVEKDPVPSSRQSIAEPISIGLLYAACLSGMISVREATPQQLRYLRGIRRARKQGKERTGRLEDDASNGTWLAIFASLVAAAYLLLDAYVRAGVEMAALPVLVLALAYVAFFAGALEYFRLSRYHAMKALFASLILLLWLFVPVFGAIIGGPIYNSPLVASLSLAMSPLFGITIVGVATLHERIGPISTGISIALVVGINVALALLMLLLAARERRHLREAENAGAKPGTGPA